MAEKDLTVKLDGGKMAEFLAMEAAMNAKKNENASHSFIHLCSSYI